MRSKRLAFVLAVGSVLALLAFFATDAGAVGTRTFELETLEELSGGDLKGVAISSDGVVRAGWTLGAVPLQDATAVWCTLTLADGSTLVGTSPEGKVFRIAGEEAKVFADTGALSVTSLVQAASGVIYAGTIAEGKIFRIAQGKSELVATLPDTSNVWALALDRSRTALFAATGPEGKLFRVEAGGASSVYFKSDDTNLVSVAVADNGDVYAGSSGKGLLYRITAPGRATVVYDFPGEPTVSVPAVALGTGPTRGVVYAIANEESEPPEPPKRTVTSGRTAAAAVTATRPKPGKGSLYRFDATGRPEKLMHHDEFHYMSLAVDDAGQPFVGTGAEGRVYTVNDAHVVTLVADTKERQVGAITLARGGGGRGGLGVIVASDPAVVHPILGRGGADSVWTSKVLDAGLRARFGVLSWHATGPLELSTRTGNTQTPDGTWNTWSPPLAGPAVVASPAGRFVQVRARWRDATTALADVKLPFMTENVRPVVLEVTAPQRGTHEGKEIPASGGEPPKHESVVKLSWKVDNPDSDPLRYRVTFQREGQTVWREVVPLTDVLTKTEVDWDTLSLPEGHYRVRVEASDELANAPDQVQRHTLESAPVLVDNTPPVFHGLTLAGRRLRGRVVDGLGPIVSVEIAVDGRLDWRPIGAADGLFDTADEGLDADLSSLVAKGSHVVAVRAFDAAGNAVVQELEAQ